MAIDANTLRVRNAAGGIATPRKIFVRNAAGSVAQVKQLWDRNPTTGAPRKIYQLDTGNIFTHAWHEVSTGIEGMSNIKYVPYFNAWFGVDESHLYKSQDGITWSECGQLDTDGEPRNWEMVTNTSDFGFVTFALENRGHKLVFIYQMNDDGEIVEMITFFDISMLSEIDLRGCRLRYDWNTNILVGYNSSTQVNAIDVGRGIVLNSGGRWESSAMITNEYDVAGSRIALTGRYWYARGLINANSLSREGEVMSRYTMDSMGYNPNNETVLHGDFEVSNVLYRYSQLTEENSTTISVGDVAIPKAMPSWFNDLGLWGVLDYTGTTDFYGWFTTDPTGVTGWKRGSRILIANGTNQTLISYHELRAGYNPTMKRLLVGIRPEGKTSTRKIRYVDA